MALQDGQDEIALSASVFFDIVATFCREFPFHNRVRHGVFWVRSKMVPECQMITQRQAVTGAHVQMVARPPCRLGKCFAIFYPKVASVGVARSGEPCNDGSQIVSGCNDDVDVEDRFGRQAWYRRAADVLDPE